MKSSSSLSLVSVPFRDSSLLCDVSSESLVPLELCRDVKMRLSFFTAALILGPGQLEDFSQPGSCGLDCSETWNFGLEPVSVDSGVRSRLMFMPLYPPSLFLLDVSPGFI